MTTNSETQRIMILDDEALIAFDLADIVEELGYRVLGPFHQVKAGMNALKDDAPDFAILDVNLGKETSEPVAQKLREMNIPFAFATGYTSRLAKVPERFPEARCISKPVQPRDISRLLKEELEIL